LLHNCFKLALQGVLARRRSPLASVDDAVEQRPAQDETDIPVGNVRQPSAAARCNARAWGCPASPPAKQFPISDSAGTNPKPSDADRDRVVDWINAGCK